MDVNLATCILSPLMSEANSPRSSLLSSILSAAFILLFSGTSFAQKNTASLVKRLKPAVVTIFCYDKGHHRLGLGTGFFVAPTHVITNYHVIDGIGSAECKLENGTTASVTGILAQNQDEDLAMIEVHVPKEQHIRTLKLHEALPEEGESVTVIGTPQGLSQTVSQGIISSIRHSGSHTTIQFTAPISEGSSGSPVLNDRGEVIGIVQAMNPNGQNLNFAIPASVAARLKPQPAVPFSIQKPSSDDAAESLDSTKMDKFKRSFVADYALKSGRRYLDEKNYQQAAGMLGVATRQDPQNPEAWFELGYCNGLLNDREGALMAFRKSVSIDSEYYPAWLYLGKSSYLLKNYGEAEKAFKRAFDDPETKLEALHNLGSVYFDQHRYEEAYNTFKQLADAHVTEADLFGIMGACLNQMGKYEEAKDMLLKSLKIDSKSIASLIELSTAYYRLGKFSEGLAILQSAIKVYPDEAELYARCGDFYRTEQKYPESLASLQKALELNPNYPEAHFSIGATYLALNDRANAEKELELLKKLDPAQAAMLQSYFKK